MSWNVVQCSQLSCSRYMVVQTNTKQKRCPYCGKRFNAADAYITSCTTQNEARRLVQQYNNQL
ncbi:MAG: hypothetical protein ACXAB7_21845 [Candidatus Kariarchaeaceae archaeon]